MEYVLMHHGIKGQKWGVRRYQNEDGSLTPAGMKRYGVGDGKDSSKIRYKQIRRNLNVDIEGAEQNIAKANTQLKKRRKDYYNTYSEDAFKKYARASLQEEYAKQDLKNEKIKEKLNNEYEISRHRQKLEDYYKAKGMTDEEAAVAAFKRVRTEKILAVTAGLTIAAVGAYAIYKHHDTAVDKFLSSGVTLKRVAANNNMAVHDGFYAVLSKNKIDVDKYKGLYANQLDLAGVDNIFHKTIQIKDGGLKIASEKTALNALKSIVGNDQNMIADLKKEIRPLRFNMFAQSPAHKKIIEGALKSLDKGKIDSNVYKALNFMGAGPDKPAVLTALYSNLKTKGYGGIVDINDKYLSGYRTKNPLIILDAGKTFVSKVESLDSDAIHLAASKSQRRIISQVGAEFLAKQSAIFGGTYAAIKGASSFVATKKNDKIVDDYRKKHPNTKMSYTEIIRAYEQGRL